MDGSTLLLRFESLPKCEQEVVLAHAIHQISIAVRGAKQPESMRAANEAIHAISSQLRNSLDGSPSYPVDVFVRSLFQGAEVRGVGDAIRGCFEDAMNQIAAAPIPVGA